MCIPGGPRADVYWAFALCKCFAGKFLFNLHKASLKVDAIVIPVSSKQKLEMETEIRELPEVKNSI